MINKKGITLIALIITIIVLLILAGVGIGLITGDNGILKKADIAKKETDESSLVEGQKLDKTNGIIEDYTTSSRGSSDAQNIKTDGVEVQLNKIYNGKQVYMASFSGTLSTGTSIVLKNLNSYNISEVLDIYGHCLVDGNTNYIPINVNYGGNYYTCFYYNMVNKELRYHCGSSYNGTSAWVTIEYTKNV